jgi:hypothetical protein
MKGIVFSNLKIFFRKDAHRTAKTATSFSQYTFLSKIRPVSQDSIYIVRKGDNRVVKKVSQDSIYIVRNE